jgi:hypothetical protein
VTRGGGALCALVVAACARTAAPPAPPRPTSGGGRAAAADSCLVGSFSGGRDTVRVALLDAVVPRHAPVPTNGAERVVFRQLYETPVRVDCGGGVRPGLAARWRSDDGDTRWTFTLRADARLWDGTSVDGETVLRSWRPDSQLPVRDVRAVDDRTIVVTLSAARPIESFGDPAWSVVKRIPESAWPIGTGPVWLGEWTRVGADSLLLARPTPNAPAGTPVLEFRPAAGRDPRDLLDGDADALVTRDPAVRRYADGRGDWRVVPLPWDRVYVLLSPARLAAGVTAQLDREQRVALARDAVRAEARAPGEPGWWTDRSCEPLPARFRAAPAGAEARVVFTRDDAVARDLADRLVARADGDLASVVGEAPRSVRTAGLDLAAFGAALAAGGEFTFVVALPRAPGDGCGATAALLARAPWLSASDGSVAAAVVPLVETRSYLLLRGAIAAALDRDGGVRLVPPPEATGQ